METTDLGNNTIKIDVNVINAWKEKVSQKFSILIEKDSCEYQMTKGESYLLYLEKLDTGSFTTDLCRGNFVESKSLTAKKWLKRYGKKAHIQS